MQDAHFRALLALHRIPELNAASLRKLLWRYHDEPQEIFRLGPQELDECGVAAAAQYAISQLEVRASRPLRERLEQDWQIAQQLKLDLLALGSSRYPPLLAEIVDPPPLLYVRGNSQVLTQPQLAMVGCRCASRQGLENAYQFARDLVDRGFSICSGMALGVDAASHRGALVAGGNTVAVVATGLDICYPRANTELQQLIVAKGAVVSEFPLGSEVRKGRFPKRNRVISGLCLGVLVIEAAQRSGSLITARCALEQGREVYALPGSIHSPVSRGCHGLIWEGASLIESSAHVLEELRGWLPLKKAGSEVVGAIMASPDVQDSREAQLLAILGYDLVPVDLLQQHCGWPLQGVLACLTELELQGQVESHAGSYQRLVQQGSIR